VTNVGDLAADLLSARLCTPSCMLAMDSLIEDCKCRCGGRWHAALIWATPEAWSGPSAVDERVGA
jgi:hypothetical protein